MLRPPVRFHPRVRPPASEAQVTQTLPLDSVVSRPSGAQVLYDTKSRSASPSGGSGRGTPGSAAAHAAGAGADPPERSRGLSMRTVTWLILPVAYACLKD